MAYGWVFRKLKIMKKIAFGIIACLSVAFVTAQDKILTKKGTIEFKASVPSFEPIEAINNSATIVLDQKGSLASLVLLNGFKFPIALMQEHFNENYVESDKFPKATLRGTLANYKEVTNGNKADYTFNGTLEMHGVTQKVSFPVTLQSKKNGTGIYATFIIKPEDYKIEIPGVVRNKIAKTIEVKVDGLLQ